MNYSPFPAAVTQRTQRTANKKEQQQQTRRNMTDNNQQTPTRTFEDAFGDVRVDEDPNARSRFGGDHQEFLAEEEARHLRLNQEDANEDFNQGRMYEDTVTQKSSMYLSCFKQQG